MKRFLKRPGGIDRYAGVQLHWQLHQRPKLSATDSQGSRITIDLSRFSTAQLHALFSHHFLPARPPTGFHRAWRHAARSAYDAGASEAALALVVAALLGCLIMLLFAVVCTRCCGPVDEHELEHL